MRRIISGRVYDTSTSRLIGAVEQGERGAPGWYRASLYRKRTGEVYIHEEGGAASPVASDLGGGVYGPGEIIEPLGYEEAQEWARDHLKPEEAARLYRDARGERGPLGIKAAPETRERLRRAAARYGRRQGDILDEIIVRCIGEDGELVEIPPKVFPDVIGRVGPVETLPSLDSLRTRADGLSQLLLGQADELPDSREVGLGPIHDAPQSCAEPTPSAHASNP